MVYDVFDSVIGEIYVVLKESEVVRVDIGKDNFVEFCEKCNEEIVRDSYKLSGVINEIKEYFSGHRKSFDLKFSINGTSFQKAVYEEMLKIPYGETRTYGEIAKNIGNSKAVRAIGGACKANNIPIIIPCHRVVGKNTLGGYMGDKIDLKVGLLRIEKK